MNYGQLKDYVLQLLNRYSIAGEKTPMSYNDQADVIARIPALVRDAVLYIATTACCLRELAPLAAPDRRGQWCVYQLPDDCYRICGGLLRMEKDGEISRYHGYQMAGARQVLIPADDDGKFMVEYFRYPALVSLTPTDSDFIDCPPEAQQAVAYYVAAHLAMEDNNYLHAALHNEFEMKLLRLKEGLTARCGTVEDVYG